MRLQVLVPTRVQVDQQARKITAEGAEGSFSLLPQHIDIVSTLRPGLLSFVDEQEQETFLAVDGGVLVKQGDRVRVSTPRAAQGPLGELQRTIDEQFRQITEQQQQARSAVEKMQADFVRRFIELEHRA